MSKEISKIYWTPTTSLIVLYGASVRFAQLNYVQYKHDMLPSGYSVVQWHGQDSNWNQDRRFSELPDLVEGRMYAIERFIQTNGLHAYFSVIFFNEEGRKLETIERDVNKFVFTVPKGMVRYQIDLVVWGSGDFVFDHFTITPMIDEKTPMVVGQPLDEKKEYTAQYFFDKVENDSLDELRVVFTEGTITQNIYPFKWVGPKSESVLYIRDQRPGSGLFRNGGQEGYEQRILDLIKSYASKYKKVTLIGYGPTSSYAAVYYNQILFAERGTHKALITSDVFKNPDEDLKLYKDVWHRAIRTGYLSEEFAQLNLESGWFNDTVETYSIPFFLNDHPVDEIGLPFNRDFSSNLVELPASENAIGTKFVSPYSSKWKFVSLKEKDEKKKWWQFSKQKKENKNDKK